ncbi:MAG: DNA-directed RNA polymerase subunit beta [Selenomonadaceae bacterium]|nr:DNA-directed RNA polymerase subunit beta [Selenomonadaceae bacterium]
MFHPVKVGKRTRYSYARIKEVMEMPHLLDIQRNSYDWFKKEGLSEIFRDISPIADFSGNLELFFEGFTFGECKYTIDECKRRDGTYAAPVRVKVKLLNKAKGDVKEQEVFMGDFPVMTETGTFIINGAERVIVSQLVRSPGTYYEKSLDNAGKTIFSATVIPNRGAWIELETDSSNSIFVRIDRTRKMPLSYFLRALDFESNDQILDLFDVNYFVQSKIHESNTALNLADFISSDDDNLDPRKPLTVGYLRRNSNKSDDTFNALLDAYSQIDSNFDQLSNLKFLLDYIAALEPKNLLAAGYKALVDMLDTDRHNVEDNKEKALIGIYNRLRPGEPPSADNAASLLHSQFFDPRRYDLAAVGRYKITKKIGWKRRLVGLQLAEDLFDSSTGELLIPADTVVTKEMLADIPDDQDEQIFNLQRDTLRHGFYYPIKLRVKSDFGNFTMLCSPTMSIKTDRILCVADIMSAVDYLFNLFAQTGLTDDIDHLGNRRVRAVGELLANQFRIGMSRMERVVRERMTSTDPDIVTPQNLINIRPVVAAIKEFFGSSQLSQFMDQHNPLSELTHKRRLSALGPGGLSRERAGFDVRDVHISHYGRMCPIETPEGPNIGLIGSLSNFARVNKYGFIETPYRIVDPVNHKVSGDVIYLTADEEEPHIIAQANVPLDDDNWFINERVTARHNQQTSKFNRDDVQLMDVSPKQVVSIATALIPFLEHDDANRALMGANMQRQAVPLLKTQAPVVGTGMEFKAACDSGVTIIARRAGTVTFVDANTIKIRPDNNADKLDIYKLTKFHRSNQGTCFNHIPIVIQGQHVDQFEPIADGPATSGGELALGYNIIVAYMPWEGYNYEDAILLNENLLKRDIFTSIHIEEYQCDARDTKLGPEEISRDIPNVSDDALAHLDSDGIITIGSDVQTGDILVGKVTPKGETELSAEERLLRAIFGEKAREVRDSSLRVPHGTSGKIVAVNIFTRDNNDELPPGVNMQVRVFIAQKRKISVGDKMSGRHGNKGVVSQIRRQEDMPFLPDGTPVDIVLNPLGVPSRMNIGQVIEAHLGFALRNIEFLIAKRDPDVPKQIADILSPDQQTINIATPVFDGAQDSDLQDAFKIAKLNPDAKSTLFDGRTGLPFQNPVTVGCVYMLKLHHLVDDKIHARSTGPYSLVTQQPLGGKAQFGGQRFGEMEVWALEAYGAAFSLQEILTVKSDDVQGRVKAYEAIVKGLNIPTPGVPESFKVLIKELQSIALDIRVLNSDSKEISIKDDDDEDSFKPNPMPEPPPDSHDSSDSHDLIADFSDSL